MNWHTIVLLLIIACINDDTTINDEDIIIELQTVEKPYTIVDTGTRAFYSNSSIISSPAEGKAYYGQDTTYIGT